VPNFGGGQDLSGVFAGLANEELRRIQTSTRQAAAQASQDQSAIDADTYSKWKAGEISDEQWIAYLQSRADSTAGEPEAHQKWMEALREHKAAISDAQMETKFQTGKITAQELMSHYSQRMQGVQTNSPAWRELAGRYQELSEFSTDGGTYINSLKGGRGGGGGSGDGDAAPTLGTEGPVDPTNTLRTPEDLGQWYDGMMSDILRIDDLNRQYAANPNAEFLVDMLTGEQFPVTADMWAQIDKQYLMTQDVFAAGKWGEGKADDAIRALAAKGKYTAEVIAPRNSARLDPVFDAMEQTFEDRIVAASQSGDPAVRTAVFKDIARELKAFEDVFLQTTVGMRMTKHTEGADDVAGPQRAVFSMTDLPPEWQPLVGTYQRSDAWQGLMQAFTDDNMDDETRRMLIDAAMEFIPSENGMSRSDVERLAGVDGTDIAFPEANGGVVGGLMNRLQRDGLLYGADPNYEGPRFTHMLDSNGNAQITEAVIDPTTMSLVPLAQDTTMLVQVAMRIGGKITTVWAEPQPLMDARFTAYKYASDQYKEGLPHTSENLTARAGDWVPSSVIQSWGKPGLAAATRAGEVTKDSLVQGVTLADGVTWYYDGGTGMLSRRPPVINGIDPITKGIQVGDDRQPIVNFKPFGQGVPVAYSGISNREMQDYVTKRAMNGSLNLEGLRQRDASGAGFTAFMFEDLNGLYYDPVTEGRNRQYSGMGSLSRMGDLDLNLTRREGSLRQQWQSENLTPELKSQWRKQPLEGLDVAEQVQEFAANVGIKGVTPSVVGPTRGGRNRIQDPMQNPMLARDNAMEARKNRAKLEQTQRQELRFGPVAGPKAKIPEAVAAPATPPITRPVAPRVGTRPTGQRPRARTRPAARRPSGGGRYTA